MSGPTEPGDYGSGGWRNVFEGPDGYYVESEPGAGGRHHDDLHVTPEGIEDKAARAAENTHVGQAVPDGSADLHPPLLLLVVARDGGAVAAFPDTPQGRTDAEQKAIRLAGWVVAAPIVADRTQ